MSAAPAAPAEKAVSAPDPELVAAQIRMREIVANANEIGPQDDAYVTPQYLKRLATVGKNITVPSTVSVLPNEDGKGFRFTRYMTPEEADAWAAECGSTTSLAKARAAAAKVLGFTAQDIADLEFIASTKKPTQAKDRLLAWTREYTKRYGA